MSNLVCGVGINDKSLCGPTCTQRSSPTGKIYLPDYDMWKGMLLRCFSEKEKLRRPGSKNPTCVESWLHRYEFQQWYFNHKVFKDTEGNTLQLDKDILFTNNHIYGPDTSILVPNYVNAVFRCGTCTEFPWVYYKSHLKSKPYRASVYYHGKHYEAGSYSNALDGHLSAQLMKIYTLELLIKDYEKELWKDERVFDAIETRIKLLMKYNTKRRVCNLF